MRLDPSSRPANTIPMHEAHFPRNALSPLVWAIKVPVSTVKPVLGWAVEFSGGGPASQASQASQASSGHGGACERISQPVRRHRVGGD